MNDTKWSELSSAFGAFQTRPAWRTRDFLTGYLSFWDADWREHFRGDYCAIEWLEIDPKNCSREEVRGVLARVGVPFEEAQYFKVFGYRR